ncbi:GNAT family N-acetyltransferase [Kaarinaea lacus]
MSNNFRVVQTSWDKHKNELIRIRTLVFINEQSVPPDLEWDGYDSDCWHVIAQSKNGEFVATGRMLYDGHIGRMAVLPEFRNHGIGSALLNELIKIATRQKLKEVFLHAQTSAIEFYEKHDFTVTSEVFMDAGIPHVTMRRSLTNIK